ncbi:MAG: hypothetical protein DRP10_04170 [Candidatus Aenigmatarchaeota archaeon]|nr:MAG: hypothetical protein DRP10_04170 [Candidatus Aenigmarchaeota archaeon]
MTTTTFVLEAGISISLVFLLFNFCMSIINSSMQMTDNLLKDIQTGDFKAINEDEAKMDNYIRGIGSISVNFLDNSDFKKDKLTEENIKKLKEAIGKYEETKDLKELKNILNQIKK